jgi:hypothetical protein
MGATDQSVITIPSKPILSRSCSCRSLLAHKGTLFTLLYAHLHQPGAGPDQLGSAPQLRGETAAKGGMTRVCGGRHLHTMQKQRRSSSSRT